MGSTEATAGVWPDLWLSSEEVAESQGVSAITVRDWILVGVVTRDAAGARTRTKLAGVKAGGRWRVSPDALAEFLRACTGSDTVQFLEPKETPAERKRRVEACRQRLKEKLGA